MICLLVTMVDSPEDKRKIEKLYDKYNRLMFSVARKILRKQEDVEDAVYHSWERIIKNLDKIGEIECKETKNFIVIITERISIDHFRKITKRQEILVDEYEQSPYIVTREKEFEKIEAVQWIRSIPKKYSEVLLLYYINELSIKDIAKVLGIKEGSVASRLSRGRIMLREGGM